MVRKNGYADAHWLRLHGQCRDCSLLIPVRVPLETVEAALALMPSMLEAANAGPDEEGMAKAGEGPVSPAVHTLFPDVALTACTLLIPC